MKRIPITISIVGGKDQMKFEKDFFGITPVPDKPGCHTHNKTVEVTAGFVVRRGGGFVRESEFALQDIYGFIEAEVPYADDAIKIVAGYFASKLLDYAKSKLKIGKKTLDIDKDQIKEALKEALDEVKDDDEEKKD